MKHFLFLTTALILIFFGIYTYTYRSARSGTVIILNGPSAAGKSSIQREFQHLMMPKLWIKLGIDNLFDKPMPDITMENLSYWQSQNDIRWVETSKDAESNNVITLFTGVDGDKVAYGMNSAIVAYAESGCDVIVDYIAYKSEWIGDLQKKLRGIKTVWVKVEIPLQALEAREAARGTSPKGHARSHYDLVHWDIAYDFILNSGNDSSVDLAKKLKEFIEHKK